MPIQAIVTIRDRQWQVTLATTPWELYRGLGDICSIPARTGMLFDTGFDQFITVTTEPMLFPTDIVWIDSYMTVVDMARNIPPGWAITSEVPARYFLEVNAQEISGVNVDDFVAVQFLARPASLQMDIVSFAAVFLMIVPLIGMVKSFTGNALAKPEGQTLSFRQSSEYVWIRLGDVAEYEKFNSPFDAGEAVGTRLALHPEEHTVLSYHYISAGVEIEPYFIGHNYISLFWGDKDAQWLRDLSNIEKREFEQGVRAGLGSQGRKRRARKLTYRAVVERQWEDLGRVFRVGEEIEVKVADVEKAKADPSIDWLVGAGYTGYYRIPFRNIRLLEGNLRLEGKGNPSSLRSFPEFEESKGKVLRFTRKILGLEASPRLRMQTVTQTMRSDKEMEGISIGDEVLVTLDNYPVGRAKIVSVDKVRLSDLDKDDAIRGGFSTIEELRSALTRAGFRFRPLKEYVANRVRFAWLSPAILSQTHSSNLDEIRPEQWKEAKGVWEIINQDFRQGGMEGTYLYALVTKYYPLDKDKQIRLVGYMNEISDYAKEYATLTVPKDIAWGKAKKWGVERAIAWEMAQILKERDRRNYHPFGGRR